MHRFQKVFLIIISLMLIGISGVVFAQTGGSAKMKKCKTTWTPVWNTSITIISSQEGVNPTSGIGDLENISNALRQGCQMQVVFTVNNSLNTEVFNCTSMSVTKNLFSCRYGGGERGISGADTDYVFAPEIVFSQDVDGAYVTTDGSTPQGEGTHFLPRSFRGITNGTGIATVYMKK